MGSKPAELLWIIGGRIGRVEVTESDAIRIATELDPEWAADAQDELSTPQFC